MSNQTKGSRDEGELLAPCYHGNHIDGAVAVLGRERRNQKVVMVQDGSRWWGIDLGGTKIEVVVCEGTSEVLRPLMRKRTLTERERGYRAIIDTVATLVHAVAAELGEGPGRVGIGTPGVVDPQTGQLKNSNTGCLNGRPIEADLAASIGCPVRVANDANCFALAEARYGAGKGAAIVFGVILGTGVGGGVVVNGQVRYGLQGIAGEWGHNVLDRAGPPCYCGKQGCVETLLSGPALEARFYQSTGKRLRLAEIAERAAAGDGEALRLRDEARADFRQAIAVVINILDPDRIVLGGGVSNLDWFDDPDLFVGTPDVFNTSVRNPIVRNQLGDSAGVYGAALLVAG